MSARTPSRIRISAVGENPVRDRLFCLGNTGFSELKLDKWLFIARGSFKISKHPWVMLLDIVHIAHLWTKARPLATRNRNIEPPRGRRGKELRYNKFFFWTFCVTKKDTETITRGFKQRCHDIYKSLWHRGTSLNQVTCHKTRAINMSNCPLPGPPLWGLSRNRKRVKPAIILLRA